MHCVQDTLVWIWIIAVVAISNAFPVVMEGDYNSFAYFGILDGSAILMNEINVKALKWEQEGKAKPIINSSKNDFCEQQKHLSTKQ